MKKWLTVGIVVACALLLGLGGAWAFRHAMKEAWVRYGEYDIRTEGSLKVADLAPDLSLQRADGSGAVQLSELFREKPLVLAFGSYT